MMISVDTDWASWALFKWRDLGIGTFPGPSDCLRDHHNCANMMIGHNIVFLPGRRHKDIYRGYLWTLNNMIHSIDWGERDAPGNQGQYDTAPSVHSLQTTLMCPEKAIPSVLDAQCPIHLAVLAHDSGALHISEAIRWAVSPAILYWSNKNVTGNRIDTYFVVSISMWNWNKSTMLK